MEKRIRLMQACLVNNSFTRKYSFLYTDDIKELCSSVDVASLQRVIQRDMGEIVPKDSQIIGMGRYGKVLDRIKGVSDWNEGTPIVLSKNIKLVKENTKKIPFTPKGVKNIFNAVIKKKLMPRIMTMVEVSYNDIDMIVINTHFDDYSENVRNRELDYLYEIVSEENNKNIPIIVTGRFNTSLEDINMMRMDSRFTELGLKRVSVHKKTNAEGTIWNEAVDHIYLPEDWEVIDKAVISLPECGDEQNKGIIVEAIIPEKVKRR